ncbi:unnamed protein product [Discula destructiva]
MSIFMKPTPDNITRTPVLVLPNVVIRPLRPSDAPFMAKHANHPDISKGMRNTFPSPYEAHHAWSFLTNIGFEHTHPSGPGPDATPILTSYALCRRSDGAYMGGIGLMPQSDVEARTFEIGYWVGKEFWGNGYATEAVRAFTAWVFETFTEVLRVEAAVFEGNEGSVRVLLKAGFQAEGVRRKAIWKRGQALDKMYFGMLREECEDLQGDTR